MIGSSVTKGIDSLSTNGLVTYLSENQNDSDTGNQTETTTAADVRSDMSPEELDLRLQFAMSLTFMIGVLQVNLKSKNKIQINTICFDFEMIVTVIFVFTV